MGRCSTLPLLVVALWLATASAVVAQPPTLPNIVLILADDLGFGDLGCYGQTAIRTPQLDRLGTEGTRFTSFYVSQAVCSASRASLFTGCYANRIGMAGALNHTSHTGIHDDEVLLSEVCRQRGYATAIFGKWHLGHRPQFLPTRHGFDEFLGIPYSNDNGPLHPVIRDIPALPLLEGERVVATDPDQSQFTRWLTERSVQFIERHRERPFFLYVPHIMPHVPIFASDRFRGRSERGLYADVVEELDWSVGEILRSLAANGLMERTWVIFASDNGPFLSYGEHAGTAGPLREGKLTTFEGGVRVPCLMRWPGRIPSGRVSDDLLSTIDLLPTITKLIGTELPARRIDGVDVWPVISGHTGGKPSRETFLYYSGDELHAVRSGPWKLHLPHDYLTVAGAPGTAGKPSNFAQIKPLGIEQSGIRGIASRHGYDVRSLELSLFDLVNDVGETQNVTAQHPEIVRLLLGQAEQARNDLGDSLTKRTGAGVRPAGLWTN
jgi:arylsulfatase A-like enzyme